MKNFNIYVDELPKGCKECGHTFYCEKDDVFDCSLIKINSEYLESDDFKKGLKLNSCPLKLLTDRLAEERKKVVQEIRELIIKSLENGIVRKNPKSSNTNLRDIILFQMLDILDQIERGE